MGKQISTLIMAMLLFLTSLVIPVSSEQITTSSSGSTLYVGGTGPGNYTSIQDAINASSNGDTIFVYNGIYVEDLVINNSIILKGEDNKNTKILGKNNVIIINSDDVEITNFNVRNYDDNSGITDFEVNSNNIKIIYNIFNRTSITFFNSNNCEISRNKGKKFSILLTDSSNNIISENEGLSIGLGDIISSSNYNVIKNNLINDHEHGIVLMGNKCSFNKITKNVIKNCGTAISCASILNTITHNDFIENGQNAYIYTTLANRWYHNYWGRPRVFPKIILGASMFGYSIDFDFKPALKPNCDFGDGIFD